jgi:hypothetical protein
MGLLAAAAVLTPIYWLTWYFGDRGALALTQSADYLAFQGAFPVADAYMAVGCFFGALGLWRHWPSALLFVIQASSAAIFLGAMDITYDLQHGLYSLGTPAVPVEVAINTMSLGSGCYGLAFAWKNRAGLLGGHAALAEGSRPDGPPRRPRSSVVERE